MRKLLLLIGVFFGLMLVTQAQDKPEREIYTVLHYGDAVFELDMWAASAAEETDRTTATWRSDNLGAVAYAAYLHFDGGVLPDTMSTYFDENWFKVTLSNYQGYREMNTCQAHEMALHEFSVLVNDEKYILRYWIQPINRTRILTFFIVFPTKDQESLDKYAALLYPNFVSCKQVSS